MTRPKGRRGLLRATDSPLASFFLGVVLALVPGVAVTLWSVSYLSDNITQLVQIGLFSILTVAILGSLVVIFRRTLLRKMGHSLKARLADAAVPLHDAVAAAIDGDMIASSENLRLGTERLVSWYSWVSVRRWIVGVMVALLAGFAALIGSALLHEQNKLIAAQNSYFQEQNASIKRQIDVNRTQSNAMRRSELTSTLFDRRACNSPPCEHMASAQSRAGAFKAIVALDRDADGVIDPTADYSGVDLRGANLEGIDLRGAKLGGADLRASNLRNARLDGANLAGANLSTADLTAADLDDTDLSRATLNGASLFQADLRDAVATMTNLDGARLQVGATLPEAANSTEGRLVRIQAAPACAACCAAFRAGSSAAQAAADEGAGASGTELRRDLDLLGIDAGLRLERQRPSRVSFAGAAGQLFVNDAIGEQVWTRTRAIAGTLTSRSPLAVDAFHVGLYLGVVLQTPAKRRGKLELDRLVELAQGIARSNAVNQAGNALSKGSKKGGFFGRVDAFEQAVSQALMCGVERR